MKRVMQDTTKAQEFFEVSRTEEHGTQYVPKRKRMQEYADAMERLREKLLVLVHICSGAPARGTEIITTRYRNSKSGAGRGIFIENGIVAYVTGYHKGYGMSAMLKVVHRYMPLEVGELLVYFMWLIQPFWNEMRALAGDITEDSPYLWPPQENEMRMGGETGAIEDWEDMDTAELEHQIRQQRQEEDDVAAIDEMMGTHMDAMEQESNDGADSTGSQKQWVKSKEWTSRRVGQALTRATSEHLNVKITTLVWRHVCIAIMRKYIKDGSVQRALSDENPDEIREEQFGAVAEENDFNYDRFVDEMAGHSEMIAGMNYARSNQEAFGVVHTRREAYRRISQAWHELLAFPSALAPGQITKERGYGDQAAWVQQAEEGQMQRWLRVRSMDLDRQLEKVAGAGAKFRSVQRPALEAIVRRVSPVVVVMGTGAGKSMLFMLPATCKGEVMDGITVLVVPTISLRKDMARRCQQMGIDCVVWNARHPQEWASIIVVVPETAVQQAFISFMKKMRQMGRLDRIVIDEAHTVLDTEHGWRLKMLDMREFIRLETQLIYLTATLPPEKVPSFRRITGIETAGPGAGAWFRGKTVRPNIEYSVRKYNRRDANEEEVVQSVVKEMLTKYPAPTKIIVYCGGKIEEVKKLADKLGAVCYYRNVSTEKEKDNIVNLLVEGDKRVFVATNALGVGIDSLLIRVVLHVGRLYKLRDYAQESGRCGRDGSKSEAIIVHGVNMDRQGREIAGEMAKWAEREMVEFVETTECRRKVMDRVMDGEVGRVGCVDGEEQCDICAGRREAARVVMASQEEERRARIRLEQQAQSQRQEEVASRAHQRRRHSRTVSRNDTIELRARWRISEQRWQEFREEQGARQELQVASQQQRGWARNERSQVMNNKEEQIRMRGILEQWKKGCILCRVVLGDGQQTERHNLRECQEPGIEQFRSMALQEEQKMRDKRAWARYIGCMGPGCGVPFEVCDSWRAREGGDGGFERTGKTWKCQYKGILMQAVLAMYHTMEEVRDWVEEEINRDGLAGVELVVWYGRQRSILGVQSNRLVEVFMRFQQQARDISKERQGQDEAEIGREEEEEQEERRSNRW